jgi:hypothetical protein
MCPPSFSGHPAGLVQGNPVWRIHDLVQMFLVVVFRCVGNSFGLVRLQDRLELPQFL